MIHPIIKKISLLVVVAISACMLVVMFFFPASLLLNSYIAHHDSHFGELTEFEYFTPIPLSVSIELQVEPSKKTTEIVHFKKSAYSCSYTIDVHNRLYSEEHVFQYYDYCYLRVNGFGITSTRLLHVDLPAGWNRISYSMNNGNIPKQTPIAMYLYGSAHGLWGVILSLSMLIKLAFVVIAETFYSIFK
jgi:hypothetical protein